MAEIVNYMGWFVRYTTNVIEHYARGPCDETDGVLVKSALPKEVLK